MSDRMTEIRTTLSHARHYPARQNAELDAQLREKMQRDIAWLLDRESQMMGALAEVANIALHCCDHPIGRNSLDECLRDFGLTLDEVEARDER